MINFNKVLTSKIISLIIAVSFILIDLSYAGAYSQGSLRVPMGESNKRMKGAIEIIGGVQSSVVARPGEKIESSSNSAIGRVVSDVGGNTLGMILMYPDVDFQKPFYQELLSKIDDGIVLFVLVPNQATFIELNDWFVQNKPAQRRIIYNALLSVSSWMRDALLIAETPQGWKFVMASLGSKSSRLDDDVFIKDRKAIKRFAVAAGIEIAETPLDIQDGDVYFNGDVVLIGDNTIRRNMINRRITKKQVEQELRDLFGAHTKLFVIEDPYNYHLDIWITLLKGREVIVGDPKMGLHVLQGGDNDQVENFYQNFRVAMTEAFSEALDDDGHSHHLTHPSPLVKKTVASLSYGQTQRLTELYSPMVDAEIRKMEASGFTVYRVPLILGYDLEGSIYPMASYNNAEIVNNTVLLPAYGLAGADSMAQKVFGRYFEVVVLNNSLHILPYQGHVRCAVQKFTSKSPNADSLWLKQVTGIVEKLDAEYPMLTALYMQLSAGGVTTETIEVSPVAGVGMLVPIAEGSETKPAVAPDKPALYLGVISGRNARGSL